jgi:4-hydroxythreonine-4-phosphate dehydrogenase
MNRERVLAVSMGHPSGAGPEVVVRALCGGALARGTDRAAVFGDAGVLERTARAVGLGSRFKALLKSGRAGVVEVTSLREKESIAGRPSEAGSLAQVDYVREAVAWAADGRAAALVTAPISKAGMISGGYNFPGHTELLARLTSAPSVAMMFVGPRLKVALATAHVPIAELPSVLKADVILARLRLAVRALQVFYGKKEPSVGVCALNPHGGEEGRLGVEEKAVIAPALELARGEGMDARGPFAADTLFARALRGEFDAVLAMYHDQALIPLKTLGFGKYVNLTLGLPFVRTSPDHGTAFDLAAARSANPSGMAQAIRVAASLSLRFPGKEAWTA